MANPLEYQTPETANRKRHSVFTLPAFFCSFCGALASIILTGQAWRIGVALCGGGVAMSILGFRSKPVLLDRIFPSFALVIGGLIFIMLIADQASRYF